MIKETLEGVPMGGGEKTDFNIGCQMTEGRGALDDRGLQVPTL
jgi:hypothetical protein